MTWACFAAWCGIAAYQIWMDWHQRLLPFWASGVAAGIGLAWLAWHLPPPFWLPVIAGRAGVALAFGAAWLGLWWRGALGLGDVATMVALVCAFNVGDGLIAITAGWLGTALAVGLRRGVRRWPTTDVVPLGPGLWLAAVAGWGVWNLPR